MAVEYQQAVQFLGQYPQMAMQRLVKILTKIGIDLSGWVQQQKLQGQVLHHRTGWLSSHVHPQTKQQGMSVTTTVGIDKNAVPYAAIHEFGFTGQENVRAHQRTISMAFGRPIEATTIEVGAFTRTMHMPERSYLRSSLRDRRDTYIEWVRGGINHD